MMPTALMTGLVLQVAAGRPAEIAVPLFFHVAGAAALIGAAATAATFAALSGPDVEAWARRLAFRVALLAALPAFVVLRVAAQVLYSREFGGAGDPGWIVFGYVTADGGFALLVVATLLMWVSARRGSRRLATAGAVLLAVAVVAWIATVWAMAAKPW